MIKRYAKRHFTQGVTVSTVRTFFPIMYEYAFAVYVDLI